MRVLVAEDDANILGGIVILLERDGYDVDGVANGEEAMKSYNREKPDFIILDIMMPKMSGYDVCRDIRRDDLVTPIIFLSAKSEEIDKVLGLELGADDFIAKPFGTRELLARIRAIGRRVLAHKPKQDNKKDNFEFGDIVVYPKQLRAKRGDISIDLGPRDCLILELLLEKKGEVVSRNKLFDRCWGVDFAGSSRTLDQHISQLRKRIEINPKEPVLIETVFGAGYRFE